MLDIRTLFLPFTYLNFLLESPKVVFLSKYPEYIGVKMNSTGVSG